MSKLTIADYLCKALTKLEPPTDWEDILEFVLASLNCPFRHKYYTKKLTQALEISSRGEITYEFAPNPLSPETCMEEESTEEEDTEEENTVEEDVEEDEESDEEEKKEAKKIKS
ncbi:uncharacterized protein [Drosophila bipectinata]|uniref:uncharacterized protein n=1 Tax=Drosophila bipectinata TaxID=42026 RepID=UPI0038B2CB80